MTKVTFLFSFVVFSSAYATEKTACYKVEGMTCAACSVTIKAAAMKVEGVASVTVDAKNDSAKVTFEDQKTTSAKIAQAITTSGYKASERSCEN